MSCTASIFTHRVLRRTVCVALLLMLGHASVARANEWREVKEPHYGEVLWSLGQRDEAVAVFKQGLLLSPENESLLETIKRLRVSL